MKRFLTKLAALVVVFAALVALDACNGEKKAPAAGTGMQVTGQVESSPSAETGEVYSQNVQITNSMGITIVETYMSVSETDDWEEDMLAGETWADGEIMEFTTDMLGSADQTWDIMVVDDAGNEMTFYEINLSAAAALEFVWGEDGTTPTVSITEAE
jgi:hypothetical protein